MKLSKGRFRLRRNVCENTSQVGLSENSSPGMTDLLIHELMHRNAALEIQIEELKHSRAELEESRNRYAELYDTSPIAYLTIDQSGLVSGINLRGCRLLGTGKDSILMKPFWQFVSIPDRPEYFSHVENMQKGESVRAFELRLMSEAGKEIDAYLKCIPWPGSSGNPDGFMAAILDITGLKSAHKERLNAEERFRTLAENAPDFIIYFDSSYRILYANQQAKIITGMPRDTLIGRTAYEAGLSEGHSEALMRTIERVFKTGKRDSVEFCFSIGGKMRTYHAQVFPSVFKDGSAEYVMCMGRDITDRKAIESGLLKTKEELEIHALMRTGELIQTNDRLKLEIEERKKAEASLEAQKELLQTVIDNIPVMLCVYDSGKTFEAVNREFTKLVGWSLDEARPENILVSMIPGREEHYGFIRSMEEALGIWKDYSLMTRQGHALSTVWSFIRLSTGKKVGIGIDLTERVNAEEERVRLAAAFDQAPQGIAIADSRLNLRYMNNAFEAAHSVTRGKYLGRDALQVLAGGKAQAWMRDEIRSVLETGKQWKGMMRMRKKGVDLDVIVSPFRVSSGDTVNYLIAERDITRERRLEQRLMETQKMEALGAFAGGIAHDLNNILLPSIMSAETALTVIPEGSSARPDIELILDAGMRGRDLVSRILSFTARKEEERIAVDLSNLVAESMKLLRPTLPSTIRISSEFCEGSGNVLADPTQIRQVIMNLLINAGQAISSGTGTIRVKIDRDDGAGLCKGNASCAGPGDYVRLTVSDTGKGIPRKDIEHIFERFFTTKKPGKGTGLGLAVTSRIVKAHGGAITVSSKPGRGSTFRVFLPRIP